MIDCSKTQLAVAACVSWSVVYKLVCAEIVRSCRGGEYVEAEGYEWNQQLEYCSWTRVGKTCVDRSDPFLNIPDGSLYGMYVHTGTAMDKLYVSVGQLRA